MDKDNEKPKTISWDFVKVEKPDIRTATEDEIREYVQQGHPHLNPEKQDRLINLWLGFQKRSQTPSGNNSDGFGF